ADRDAAGGDAAEEGFDPGEAVRNLHGDALAGAKPPCMPCTGGPGDGFAQLAVAARLRAADECDVVVVAVGEENRGRVQRHGRLRVFFRLRRVPRPRRAGPWLRRAVRAPVAAP